MLRSLNVPALRQELTATFRLSVPVATVQLGMMMMGVVDTIMLGHVSAQALAASALGHIVTFTLMILAYGILSALDPLMTQAFGASDHRVIEAHLQRGIVMALALTLPLALALWDVGWVFHLLGQQAEVVDPAGDYARAIIWGIPAYLLFIVLRQTLQAMSVVRPAIVAIVLANVLDAFANWVLIFGKLGAPALGVIGAAHSTSLCRWTMFLYLFWAARRKLAPYWHGFTAEAISLASHLRLLRIGLPIGLHNSLELMVFSTVAFLMGQMGVVELAGHQIALNMASLSFMLPLGVSGAATTRVGNAVGRADMPGARRAAAASLFLGAGVMVIFAVLFSLLPEPLARLYTNDPAVIAMTVALLPIAAVFQVFDGIQVVGAGILRGTADTAFPAAMALVGFWAIGLPAGWYLAFRTGVGPKGLWWGLTLGLAVVAMFFVSRILIRFRSHIARVDPHPTLSHPPSRPPGEGENSDEGSALVSSLLSRGKGGRMGEEGRGGEG